MKKSTVLKVCMKKYSWKILFFVYFCNRLYIIIYYKSKSTQKEELKK